ncbi:MAG TPA: SDR family NAD(P)-dependent oxidoreductase [Gelria sp.]|jgi:3-hydroxyacyl-CoA dehydrogenase/3-hydroxy-2-methylbutyryl-CoA dehydrogenase|nr:SDR family NAD(P)-dependent oxidoreductase [Gelria sp.]
MDINGLVAIVTGGASGLGAAAAEMLIDKGAKVVVADLNEEKGKEFVGKFGDNAAFVKCDVTNTAENEAVVKAAVDKFGRVDALINAAGIGSASRTIGRDGPMPLEWFTMTVNINLIGTFDMLRLAAAQIAKNEPNENGEKGAIINVASVAAFDGQIGQAAYSASKGGVVAMTLPIARDLSRDGIRVNTIAPGIFDTPMMQLLPEKARQSLGAQVPFPQRLGNPSEFAHLCCAVIENPYINAQAIRLDGAIRMGPK